MYPQRIAHLLVAACSIATVARATIADAAGAPEIEERQVVSVSVGPTAQATTSSSTPTSSPTEPPSTSRTPPPETTSRTTPTSSVPPRTTTTPSSTSSSAEPITETLTTVITATNSDGSLTSYTKATTATTTPDLSKDPNANTSTIDTGTRNIIIGVVVGVGGAIVLAALALVAFRIWGRKKPVEEDDGLMSYGAGTGTGGGSYGGFEKSDAGSSAGGGTVRGPTPFQSTLESYHAPSHVNPSSNF